MLNFNMELISREIVEIIKLNDAKHVLCQIIIKPREISSAQNESHLSYRWMRAADWAAFYSAILKLLDCDFESPQRVSLNSSSIELNVEKIDISDARRLKDIHGNDLKSIRLDMGLKCQVEYLNHNREQTLNGLNSESHIKVNPDVVLTESTKVSKRSTSPAVKEKQTKSLKIEDFKETLTLKQTKIVSRSRTINGDAPKFQDQFVDFTKSGEDIKIREREKLQAERTKNQKTIKRNVKTSLQLKKTNINEKIDTENSALRQEELRTPKLTKIIENNKNTIEHSNRSDETKDLAPHDNSNNEQINNSTESDDSIKKDKDNKNIDDVIENTTEKEKETEKKVHPTQVRRSARSPTKPQRYRDILPEVRKRSKELDDVEPDKKRLTKCKELIMAQNKTPQKLKSTKTPEPKSCHKAHFRNATTNNAVKTLNGNRKLINQKLKYDIQEEFLRELASTTSSEVPLFTLNDMSSEAIMETLESVRWNLNSLFQKLCGKSYINGHEGINHYLVIGLVSNDMQKLMMNKLSELYETEESPKYGTHFINVLMPEWILTIFMARFNMNREQAIEQIKKQNKVYRIKPIERRET